MGLTRKGSGWDLAKFNVIIVLDCWAQQGERSKASLDVQAVDINK